ncbi:hypothetical protein BVRB_8g182000 [Beta vulgaris subsp. vulgaris]|nr:hypothetical protein BVRB_8g182000 [Beta vulgaris subsp. vulgaris]
MPTGTNEADILRKARLDALRIGCFSWDQGHFHEILLEGLYPNHDLSKIVIHGYQGTKLPSWALMMGTYLPQLVTIELWGLHKLQHLSSLSELCHLKCLQLSYMDDLDYIDGPFILASRSAGLMTFFPSLEKLCLFNMPKLKGWWRDLVLVEADTATADSFIDGNGRREQVVIPSFPRLHELEIQGFPSMTYFPPCPLAKKVKLLRCNEALTFCMKEGVPSAVIIGSSSSSTSNLLPISVSDTSNSGDPILFEHLTVDDAGILNSLLEEFGRGAIQISIAKSQMDSFSVCKLGFLRLPKLVNLPEGLQHVTTLRSLCIHSCKKLKTLCSLQSLTELVIHWCNKELRDRCREPDGEDWPKIRHISHLDIR